MRLVAVCVLTVAAAWSGLAHAVGSGGAGLFRIKQGQIDRVTHQEGSRDDRRHSVIGDYQMVGGVAVLAPQTLLRGSPPLSVKIDTVTINGVSVTTEGQRSAVGAGAVSFRYSAPAVWSASRLRYRVRLLGLNAGWTQRDRAEHADFSDVPPGRYTFEVQVYSADRPELERQARWTFELLPPVYLRAWFGIAAVLGCVALAAALLRARVLRSRRMEAALSADRRRIAQDIHDSLEQDLCGVKLQVDAAELWINTDPARARQHLARASDLVADGMVDMRTAIWGLRQGSLQGSELALGLEQRLRRITDAAQVQLTFVLQGQAPNLPSMFATQLSYIARESVTNSIKHAQAQHLNVRLDFRETGKVRLFIQDDGVGMPAQGLVSSRDGTLPGGLGLDGMRSRAELIKGTLTVTSPPQGGTTIEVQAAFLRT